MKYVLIATFLITGSAFAYNSSTVGDHPVREEAVMPETRDPASVEPAPETKEVKASEKHKASKVAPDK